jgi:hypothetical protein
MPFMAILPKSAYDYRKRAEEFQELGALKILERARDLEPWLE